MSRNPVSMRKARKILHLKHETGLGIREIARSVKVSHGSVLNYLKRAEEAGIGWPLPEEINDEELQELLFSGKRSARKASRPLPSMEWVHRELGRTKGVTLRLVWEEYRREHPKDGYGYTQFCEYYRQYQARIDPVLRQHHIPGEKMFVDWAGETIPIVGSKPGQHLGVGLFVATLGASSYTFAAAYLDMRLNHWLQAHIDAWNFMEGVARLTVPDNPKTAVNRACYYEPVIHRSYEELAEHFHTVILPARSGKAKDKASVEKGVQEAERRIIAVLRNQTFFSLEELNRAIRKALDDLNHRPFQKMDGCRRDRYLQLDRPALQPLPSHPFEIAQWRQAKVNIDYHVQVDWHFYSVPFHLVNQQVDVRLSPKTVEILYKGKRVALHPRSLVRGQATTDPGHRPKNHQFHSDWTPQRMIQWAQSDVGPSCAQAVTRILESKAHPEQGYRACLGVIRMRRHFGKERMEAACRRALALNVCSYRSIKSILNTRLDQQPLPEGDNPPAEPVIHSNLRGPDYYH